MSVPDLEPAPRAEAETLERPDETAVVVRYFKIDFDRCVIRQGSRVKVSPPRARACGGRRPRTTPSR